MPGQDSMGKYVVGWSRDGHVKWFDDAASTLPRLHSLTINSSNVSVNIAHESAIAVMNLHACHAAHIKGLD